MKEKPVAPTSGKMNDATGRNQDGKAAQDNDTSADDTTAQDGTAVSIKHTTDAARGVRD